MTKTLVVTGNIGSGKSTAGRFFAQQGAIRIDADQLARDVVEPGQPAYTQLVDAFGQSILASDGRIDRKALGRVIFDDPQKKAQLESITHPQIRLAMMTAIAKAQQKSPPAVILEIPLFFEGGMHKQFPESLLIIADEGLRLQRVLARDNLDESEARARMNSQMPQAEKIPLATYVIENNHDLQALEAQLREFWEQNIV